MLYIVGSIVLIVYRILKYTEPVNFILQSLTMSSYYCVGSTGIIYLENME